MSVACFAQVLRLFALLVLPMQLGVASAQFALSDDRAGMTCHNYAANARLAWLRQGGDWLDQSGTPHGDRPFARQIVGNSIERQTVVWDVTGLAQEWAGGALPQGGVFLRQLADPASSVVFHSREGEDAAVVPRLIVEWDDGVRRELQPSADSTMDCSSFSGKGTKSTLQVGGRRSIILVFPFEPRDGAQVRSARLQLVSDRQHRSTSEIGVFRLDAPFARSAKPRFGIAADFRADTGLEGHPSVIFATSFESRNWLDDWSSISDSSNASLVRSADGNGFEPLADNALKVTVLEGKKMGLNLLYRFKEKTGSEPEEAYLRYYVRLGVNWTPRAGGKLPGLSGTYNRAGWGGRRSDGTNGWSARGRFVGASSERPGLNPIGSYVYHAGMTKKYGSGWGWNLGSTGLLENNRWYSIEQQVRLNQPGKEDGVLRAWIDGELVFEQTDIRYRDTRDLRIETVWMNVYHGGTARAPHDLTLYIDNVVVASEYIGPMSPGRTGPGR